eukprot:TRINITY_DN960_c0_g2_i1.p2 TRINITY_DN960_c0_g2~~TRINITY_DN960_c0_g2_i1.p2  ORF type:complete len:367 (+),score=130.06 TRINITY_DN960_c0_g2_i1:45-1103(+)
MFACVALLCMVATSAMADKYQDAFVQWATEHQRSFESHEFNDKYATFKANLDFIEAHNADESKTHTVALNQFADLTGAEFAAIYNGVRYTHDEAREQIPLPDELANVDMDAIPASMDWRTKGAVTAVKNQGQCGSCWSFSTTGSIEGQHFLSGQGPLVSLSEQNLMDCSWNEGDNACNGGLMDDAFKYVIQNGGIDTEASYPYQMASSHVCKYKVGNRGACISSYQDIPSGNEQALTAASATIGPISVAIDASHQSFQFYSGGVYYEPACSSTQLDHGVLVVGYGSQNNEDYYIVKNSWSPSWGLNGYILMSRNRQNNCGLATSASYPQIAQGLQCASPPPTAPTPSPTPWW